MKTKVAIACIVVVIVISGFISPIYANGAENVKIITGVIDLRQWNPFKSKEIIALDGEWEFYWKQLLSPAQLGKLNHERFYMQSPSEWSKLTVNNKPLEKKGFATYRVTIRLSEEAVNQQLALYIPASCSAYKVWVNNKEVITSGVVGTSIDTEKPWTSSHIAYFTPFSQNVEVVVQISNFHQRKNGMWDSFLLGNADVLTKKDSQDYALQLIMMGSFLVMSIFYFFTYFFRRVNGMALFFSLACFMLSIRLAVIDGYILRYFITDSLFEVVLKLEYLSIVLFAVFLIHYIERVFPFEKNTFFMRTFTTIGVVYSLFILVTPAAIYTMTLNFLLGYMVIMIIYHVLYVYPLASIRKRQWARVNAIAAIVVIVTYINDIIYYTGNFSGVSLGYAGFFVFFFVQIMTMAAQMSDAYKRLEVVSSELLDLNTNLEQIVKDRTSQLEQLNKQLSTSNEKLLKIEQSRRKFLSNISHDLGTPMQSALGYVEMLCNGMIKDNQQKYLHIVYDKLQFIRKLVTDLFELTKIEENQIIYQFVETDFQLFLCNIERHFALDFERKNLTFKVMPIEGLLIGEKVFVYMDVFRMEQVFQNLLQNAMKYTLEGGTVRIEVELVRPMGKLIVYVSDTGVGMDQELLPQVFNRFVKGDEARTAGLEAGMGLGLSIVREVVLAHNGEVFVNSEKDVGSTFSIVLPVAVIMNEK